MKRRDFGNVCITSALTVGSTFYHPLQTAAQNEKTDKSKPRMHVGDQGFSETREYMEFLKRHGVNNVDGGQPQYHPGIGWKREDVFKRKDLCDAFSISLDMMHLPLSSIGVDTSPMPYILLGKSPERDREIEDIGKIIKLSAEAGIHGLNYNLTILPVLRTGTTPGRGGSQYSTWKYADAPAGSMTRAGKVPLDVFWERIIYFLERVIPVADEYKVRMACHIADPGTVPGYRGVDRALGTVEGLKHFIELSPSPYHGFNFCVGSAAEALKNPGLEIYDVVRYFGERKKIFNIHFRNIKGHRDDFQEVYPDEGDLDMYRIMKILKDVEYPYMLMPDHMPYHPDDTGGRQAFAFGFGYIKALIQAVAAEG